ncbi:DUF1501 domain-containing protein [Herbaspirillum sp. ST 5-3]|uniref:DUF1501 domain-containing protein n=1 Tax=Oxalobacteraceae TaxID=75682 RepID=UPI0010A3FCF4|nr:DUF1501 domain-containing protein [Herbaspirillum sp. ST 5-3]
MKRRDVLKVLASLPLAGSAGSLFAAPAARSKLLLVFLRGGYDAANLLVPVSSQFYYEARPNIAIARPGPDLNAALPLDADWGLHPVLRDSVHPLFSAGQAAFIPFAGTEDTSRSHFETQDAIELGQPAGRGRDFQSGFLNRLVMELNGKDAIAFTDRLPLILQGRAQVPNASLRAAARTNVDARQSSLIASMYRGTELEQQVNDGFHLRDELMQEMGGIMGREMEAANRNAISTRGFESVARRIATLMRDRYNIGFVDVGGWDTHVGEGGASGLLAGRLDALGRGLAAFAQEMGGAWRDTVTVVISEFGRTFRENGNRGTDHGHGTVYWVLGGSVRGGRIAGEQVRVEQTTLFQDRDYPILNEYRAVLGGLFARMYGLRSAQLERVFTGVKDRDIGLV